MIKYSGMSYLNVNFTIATLTKNKGGFETKILFISILQKHFNKVFLAFTFNEFHFREASVTYNQLRLSIGILKMKSLCLTMHNIQISVFCRIFRTVNQAACVLLETQNVK